MSHVQEGPAKQSSSPTSMEQLQAESPAQTPERPEGKPVKAFSCLRCFERKVKCDKNHPCSNCIRSNVECNFRVPSAPRRKKKKRGAEEILLDRLRRAEDLLRSKGISLESPEATSSPSKAESLLSVASNRFGPQPTFSQTEANSRQTLFNPGKLIVDSSGSRSRFIENNLWSSVSSEFPDPNDAIDDESSDDEGDTVVGGDDNTDFLLGLTPSTSGIGHLHPNQEGAFKLWAVFLENINPMTKIIHYPTFQEKLVQASQDVEKIERGLEPLMFAIYLGAATSLDDAECERTFKEPRSILRRRYREGTKKALSRSRFLGTSDIQVLQAFVLYLLMMRDDYDSRTMWTLAGVANRIAQSMGIHRDGTTLGLPPFETEMRRRLWWQITILDFRSAELSGSGRFGDISLSDTRVPTNTNDADIWPGMTEPPVDQTLPTEMLVCLLRCEFGSYWKEKMLQRGIVGHVDNKEVLMANKDASNVGKGTWPPSTEERDNYIVELETRLQEKFLQYCDHTIPLQLLASLIAKAAIGAMRLIAHHPRRWAVDSEVPEATKKFLWDTAIRLLQTDNITQVTGVLKKFRWHTNVYFQWQAMIYLLGELRTQTRGPHVDEAWKQVDEAWANHPQFVTEYRKPLHVAVGNLCLKAYEARERSLREEYEEKKAQGMFALPLNTPPYIEMLRQQREMTRRKDVKTDSPVNRATPVSNTARSGSEDVHTAPTPTPFQPSQPQRSFGLPPTPMPMAWTGGGGDALPTGQFSHDPMMMKYDPNLGLSEASESDVQMDWNQWDYLIQELERPNLGGHWGV